MVRSRDAAPSTPPPLAPTVSFEGVTFSYPGGRRAALEALSFSVAAGERVGVVGASGAGKSTISRLLLRFADPPRAASPSAGTTCASSRCGTCGG